MTVELSPELEKIMKAKVASGIYPNAYEFIREAILRSLEWERLKKQKLDAAITIGLEQADRGEFSKRTAKKSLQKVRLVIAWSLEDFAGSLRLCVRF